MHTYNSTPPKDSRTISITSANTHKGERQFQKFVAVKQIFFFKCPISAA